MSGTTAAAAERSDGRREAVLAVLDASLEKSCTASSHIRAAIIQVHGGEVVVAGTDVLVGIGSLVGWARVYESRSKVEGMVQAVHLTLAALGISAVEFSYGGRAEDVPRGLPSALLVNFATQGGPARPAKAARVHRASRLSQRAIAKGRRAELQAYLESREGDWIGIQELADTLPLYDLNNTASGKCESKNPEHARRGRVMHDIRCIEKTSRGVKTRYVASPHNRQTVQVAFKPTSGLRPSTRSAAGDFLADLVPGRWYTAAEAKTALYKLGCKTSKINVRESVQKAADSEPRLYEHRLGPRLSMRGKPLFCVRKIGPRRSWWKRFLGIS